MTPRAQAPSPEERRDRLGRVCELVSLAHTAREIERLLADEWSCSRRTVRRYMRAAMRTLQVEARADTKATMLAELRGMQRRAYAMGDVGAALRALEARARVQGMQAPNWRHVTHELVGPQPAVIAEVRKPAAELAVEARALVAANAPIADDEDP